MKKYKCLGKRLLIILMIASVIITAPSFSEKVFAVASSEKQEKADAEDDLKDAESQLDSLENSSEAVSSQISKTQSEIDDMISAIEDVQNKIESKQEEIDQCEQNLEDAEAVADEQYSSMKLRIQYMYENSTSNSMWMAIFEADGIADLLNRLEYVSSVYESDRNLLSSYQDAIAEIEALQEKLTSDMDELTALQDQYNEQEEALETKMASLKEQKSKYASEISKYESIVSQKKALIASLAATIQKAEEAAAKKAAAEAARKAASSSSSSGSYDGGGSSGSGNSSDTNGDYDPSPSTSVTGDQIVAYALQFVGNPYVWGGDSLTNGCDCSGFVHLIYAHFGISTPRYSQSFLNYGKKVSYNNLQAGDVVVYPGHVAIYMGNGKIVEAQCKKAGITAYRSVNCHSINGIRRYI